MKHQVKGSIFPVWPLSLSLNKAREIKIIIIIIINVER